MKSRVQAIAVGALISALVSVLIWQQRVIDDLRSENTALHETSKPLTRNRSTGTDDATGEEIETYRQRASEVHGLRNRLAQLSREKDELQEEAQRLRKESNSEGITRDPQEQRNLRRTNERLDVAIEGIGFFEVTLPNGTQAYTRDGSWKLAPDGRISTKSGLPYQMGAPIVPSGSTDIEILPNGEMKVTGPSGAETYRIQLVRFSNPAGLEHFDLDLYKRSAASRPPEVGNPGENGFGKLAQGFVETSD